MEDSELEESGDGGSSTDGDWIVELLKIESIGVADGLEVRYEENKSNQE